MRWIPIALIGGHGVIHLMGFAKGVGFAELPQLTQPISRATGLVWLLAAVLVTTAAGMLAAGARSYWIVAALGVIVSQAFIFSAWDDARAGTVANVLLLLVVAFGWLTEGPRSFHAQYLRDVSVGLARVAPAPIVTEADIGHLPDPGQRYLRVTRSVGQPRVQSYRVHFRGRIRSAPDSRWMPLEAEQQSFADRPTRLFLMRARMFGLPVEAFHRAVDGHAQSFESDDRSRSEPDGTFTARRFSTPVRDYRDYGSVRLMSFGEARWHLPDGEFTYGEFHLVDVSYNGQ